MLGGRAWQVWRSLCGIMWIYSGDIQATASRMRRRQSHNASQTLGPASKKTRSQGNANARENWEKTSLNTPHSPVPSCMLVLPTAPAPADSFIPWAAKGHSLHSLCLTLGCVLSLTIQLCGRSLQNLSSIPFQGHQGSNLYRRKPWILFSSANIYQITWSTLSGPY